MKLQTVNLTKLSSLNAADKKKRWAKMCAESPTLADQLRAQAQAVLKDPNVRLLVDTFDATVHLIIQPKPPTPE